jgi:arsenate reductase
MAVFLFGLLIFITGVQESDEQDNSFNRLYPILNEYVRDFPDEFDKISEERRFRLNEMVYFLEEQIQNNGPAQINFITTNEATVGQMAKVWAKAAAHYFGFNHFHSYSGGLAPDQISVNTIMAMEKAGFIVYKTEVNNLDVFQIKYSYNLDPIIAFPKKINHFRNPVNEFMAVILDQNADMNIDNIKGTYNRLFLSYEDPKGYEGSVQEEEKFSASCRKIAVEMFYVFSQLHKRVKEH